MAWGRTASGDDNGDASAPQPMPPWGSVLQDKYVNARVVACCPTMDLIAILTADRQLQVHRTISWQRIVHVKPSEVFFTMETLAWSPDGMRLAVGCDEGELVVFSMATAGDDKGVEIKPHTSEDDTLHHQKTIVAVHWVAVRDSESAASAALPSAVFRNRTAAFTAPGASDTAAVSCVEDASVLVTADAAGKLGIWWNGLVLVAMIPLQEHWRAQAKEPPADSLELTVHSVMLTSDLSALFVDVSRQGQDNERLAGRQVLRLDLSASLQTVKGELGGVSRVGYEVRSILERVRTSLRQMASEWKNATRVFELKMSLIGSLYEKYGYEEPPQVDMLAIVAGGIASPALAQYFAQDIQEMSIIRMQKMLMSGCETIQQLLDAKIKNGLQQILFEAAELRGAVKWKHRVFRRTLGIATHELDAVVDNTRTLLTAMEELGKSLHETRQDFSLFLKWLLERIRIHTNDTSSRTSSAATPSTSGNGMHESLLNIRRLVAFLERAAETAKAFQVKKNNKFLVEVTFGNPVSQLFSSQNFVDSVNAVDRQWSDIMTRMLRSLSASVEPERGIGLRLPDEVDEVHLHTRWPDHMHEQSASGGDADMDDEDTGGGDEEEDFDIMEAVDWDSLESVREEKEGMAKVRTPVVVIAARCNRSITLFTCNEGSYDLGWRAASLDLRFLSGGGEVHPRISFYGGTNGGKRERLVVTANGLEGRDGSLYMVDYGPSLSRIPRLGMTSSILTSSMNAPTSSIDGASDVRHRAIRSTPAETGSQFAVITQASRGIVCVIVGNARVVVLDAEEDPDEEENEEVSPGDDGESEDHDEGDL